MTAVELIGIALALLGLVFAFETPRRWFVRTFRLQRATRLAEGSVGLTKAGSAEPLVDNVAAPPGPSPEASTVEPLTRPSLSSITVKEIVDAIHDAPPFQRKAVEAQYTGIWVEWEGFLKEVIPDPRDEALAMVNLILDKTRVAFYSIWFNVHPDRFPEIKTLQKGARVRVRGTITSTSGGGMCVTLRPEAVEVLERTRP